MKNNAFMISRNLYLVFILVFLCGCNNKTSKITENLNSEMHSISNDTLTVSVKTKGAELTSIRHNEKEYLWQGNPEFWKHQSPVLFPIVGRLVDHEYIYQDKTYPMNFHGFAWKNNFKLIEKSSNSLTFELTSSDELKEIYPFDFILHIKYTLKGKSLNVEYEVKNLSKKEGLYFSIGAHPAFNCPIEADHKREDYQLVFDTDAMPKSQDKKSGLFINKYTQYFEEPGILKLQDTTFNNGALVFNPNPFNKATLIHEPSQTKYLSMTFKNFPYLGIWSAKNNNEKIAPLVCIEPWYGVADFENHDKHIIKKTGINNLEPNDVFNCSFTIEIL